MNENSSKESLTDSNLIARENSVQTSESSTESQASKALEMAASSGAQGSQQSAATMLPNPVPQVSTVNPVSQPPQSNDVPTVTPQIADDADLIEKEWVMRAKHIVEQTKDDPYTQNREMSKMKADYIKKRYGRDMKVVP